jgi:hypothetical protein
MTFLDFIAMIGGTFGLCLGFSLVSVVEFVYWAVIKMTRNIHAKQP